MKNTTLLIIIGAIVALVLVLPKLLECKIRKSIGASPGCVDLPLNGQQCPANYPNQYCADIGGIPSCECCPN